MAHPNRALGTAQVDRPLRTLQTKSIKIGAKVVSLARYTCFQMAEVSITQDLFAAILRRIRRLIQPVLV